MEPIGKMVSVNGHDMHVFTEGTGDTTLVFLSGYGTLIPCYDFSPLYDGLKDKYRIVVIERAGYGYSEATDNSRDINTVVEENREALKLAGIEEPFVIVPHSMSGLEALYWAQTYPDEVKAIIGLDAAFPDWYLQEDAEESEQQAIRKDELFSGFMRFGFIRFNPEVTEHAKQNDDEIRALIYKNMYNHTLINEEKAVRHNATTVLENKLPYQTPVLCFISDGSEISPKWREKSLSFWSEFEDVDCRLVDSGHYIHTEKPDFIVTSITNFLDSGKHMESISEEVVL